MQRFLETCASYVYRKHGNDLSDVCVVVPNRRSGVFFNAYLRKQIPHPVIGPKITTINEWMLSFSELCQADRLQLIAALYGVFREQTGSAESFDDFYFWGEVMLSDFDDIDKYQANASDLFRNLLSLKDIEQQFDYLTVEQKSVLRQFWGSFGSWEKFEQERNFLSLWEKLYSIYSEFRKLIAGKGTGYPGMIMREGVSDLESGKVVLNYGAYVVIGMNALNACEKKAFTILKQSGKALFLWDYDEFYITNKANNAGRFLRENLRLFPAPEDFRPETRQFSQPKNIEIVAVPSLTGQGQVIPGFLRKNGIQGKSGFDSTAIVLADESLLFPVLGAIPPEAGPVNVTMGYPVKNSPIVSLLFLISALIRNPGHDMEPGRGFYHKMVTDILSHQLMKEAEPEKTTELIREIKTRNRIYIQPQELGYSVIHSRIFTIPDTVGEYASWFMDIIRLLVEKTCAGDEKRMLKETFYAVYLALEKLDTMVRENLASGTAGLTPAVWFRLMMQHLNQVSVPFEGEPLSGIQVMGVLETRCLDFDNVIIIGLNEDTWPRTGTGASMIPYNIRKGFGLPGIDDQDAMYAYYFYRLIQSAENITATWNTIRDVNTGGELSRFAFQLLLNSPHKVSKSGFDYLFLKNTTRPFSVTANPAIAGHLLQIYQSDKALSPSAINSFLLCRLQFYFRYVMGIREEDEVKDEIDRAAFGTIFHKTVEMLYLPFINRTMEEQDLQNILSDRAGIEDAVLQAMSEEFYKSAPTVRVKPEGKSLLMKFALEKYVRNLLEFDLSKVPFRIISVEKNYDTLIEAEVDLVMRKIRIGGKSDRVDESGGIIRIVDYKTGSLESSDLNFNSLESLFDGSQKEIRKEAIQSLLYAWILGKNIAVSKPLKAEVYSVLNLKNEKFQTDVRMNKMPLDVSGVVSDIEFHLKKLLGEIFSSSVIFSQTEFPERCRICSYSDFCGRG